MRFGCIGLIIGAALTWGGGQQVYESWNAGKKVDMTLAQFLAEKPGVGWYRLTDAHWRLVDAGVITGAAGAASGSIYAPVTGKVPDNKAPDSGGPGKAKIRVLLHRSNDAEAERLAALFKETDPTKYDALLSADPTLAKERPVEGMVEFGINSDDKDNDAIKRSFAGELADDYIVITDGAEPAGYLWPLLTLLAGLALLGFTLRGLGKEGEPDAVDQ